MLGFVLACNQGRIWQLVELVLYKTNGECCRRGGGLQCHRRDNQTRIDSSAQKRAQGHVGNHPETDGFIERGAKALARLRLAQIGWRLGRRHLELPESPALDFPAGMKI